MAQCRSCLCWQVPVTSKMSDADARYGFECGEQHLPLLQVGDKLPNKAEPAYQYSEVLHKSFLFYFQQRSGKLPHQVSFCSSALTSNTYEDRALQTQCLWISYTDRGVQTGSLWTSSVRCMSTAWDLVRSSATIRGF